MGVASALYRDGLPFCPVMQLTVRDALSAKLVISNKKIR